MLKVDNVIPSVPKHTVGHVRIHLRVSNIGPYINATVGPTSIEITYHASHLPSQAGVVLVPVPVPGTNNSGGSTI